MLLGQVNKQLPSKLHFTYWNCPLLFTANWLHLLLNGYDSHVHSVWWYLEGIELVKLDAC